jgi:hypothetical protein
VGEWSYEVVSGQNQASGSQVTDKDFEIEVRGIRRGSLDFAKDSGE